MSIAYPKGQQPARSQAAGCSRRVLFPSNRSPKSYTTMRSFVKTLVRLVVILTALTSTLTAQTPAFCPEDTCNCRGDLIQIELYYFGPANVKLEVFPNSALTAPFFTQNGLTNGQLITLSSVGLPESVFPGYLYLRTTDATGETCLTTLYSKCPVNAFPGAKEDLRIVGKTFGNFTVYSYTDQETRRTCSLDNLESGWLVGGNLVGPTKNTLGTLNEQPLTFITDAISRGVITPEGNFGLGTTTPSARLEVAGTTLLQQSLQVDGFATITNTLPTTTTTDGALVVAGGVGIGGSLNLGSQLRVEGTSTLQGATTIDDNATITGNAAVDGTLRVAGASTLQGATTIDDDATITGNAAITGGLTLTGSLQANSNATIVGNLHLHRALEFAPTRTMVIQPFGSDFLVENRIGRLRFSASNEEMMIITPNEVEVKKRIVVTGADLAERFAINLPTPTATLLPGMVVSIDPSRPGELAIATEAYDTKVAGIVSGAGGVEPGLLLGQPGTLADGDVPVAVTGRVYCYVDADFGAIAPGDFLTTSSTWGHAMKVGAGADARGAIIGKAMTALPAGKGLVLVLISMQ